MSHKTEDRKKFVKNISILGTEYDYLVDRSMEFASDFNERSSDEVVIAIADMRQTLNNLESIVVEYYPNVLETCLSVDH